MKYGNYTAKDTFNSVGAAKLSDVATPITVVGLEIEDRPDKDGVVVTTSTLKDKEGNLYGTISPSAIQQIGALGQMFEEGTAEATILVVHKKSAQGRDYIQLELQ